ncbi:MAG: phosphotransferase [Phycisphaerales bacterium]|nr:phosphotransferase [Phycisphaerales bacterium]
MMMTPLHATFRLLRDARCSLRVPSTLRKRWSHRLAMLAEGLLDVPAHTLSVRFRPRVRVGAGGRMLRAIVTGGQRTLAVRLKWCPGADPAALDATERNMRWWRAQHPQLCEPVADLLDYWPDDRVLVIAERRGEPLNTGGGDAPVVSKIANWLRKYAEGDNTYGEDVSPLLLATVQRTAAGKLRVNARPLLEARIASASKSAANLVKRGFAFARDWRDHFDIDTLLRAHSAEQPAGFVHGDFKPGNVLVDGDDFAVIDWWIAPCVSWPLTDVATFAGAIWLDGTPKCQSLWRSFRDTYFPNDVNDVTRQTIDLLATCMCLGYLDRRAQSPGNRLIEQRRIAATLHRLRHPTTNIAHTPIATEVAAR